MGVRRKKLNYAVSLLLGCTMCCSGFASAGEITPINSVEKALKANYGGALGLFSIFVKEDLYINAHTVGNIAAGGDVSGNSGFGGYDDKKALYTGADGYINELGSNINYINGKWIAGGSKYAWNSSGFNGQRGILCLGESNIVEPGTNSNQIKVNGQDRENNGFDIVNIGDLKHKIDFEDAFSNLINLSDRLGTWQGETFTSDTTELVYNPANEVQVFNTTSKDFCMTGSIQNGLNINGIEKGNLCIINIDCKDQSGDFTTPKILINNSAEDFNPLAGNIIFNFYNVGQNPGYTITLKEIVGQVLAPEADVANEGNLDGSVVANTFNIRAEAHAIPLRKKYLVSHQQKHQSQR